MAPHRTVGRRRGPGRWRRGIPSRDPTRPRDWAKSRGIVATAEKPKHNGKPAPQMPKDVKDYRYLMTMTHPWGLPKEITDLWEHEDSTYTWEVPPYED